MEIPASAFDDGFSVLEGKLYDTLNPAVSKAAGQAHFKAGIPILGFSIDQITNRINENINEESIGEFMYLQMISTYFSAAFLGVEPFDQNGVEQYKRNLLRELGIL